MLRIVARAEAKLLLQMSMKFTQSRFREVADKAPLLVIAGEHKLVGLRPLQTLSRPWPAKSE